MPITITTNSHTRYDLESFRGRRGLASIEDLTVAVEIVDARTRFGHLDFQVRPLAGSGEQWIEQHRVELV